MIDQSARRDAFAPAQPVGKQPELMDTLAAAGNIRSRGRGLFGSGHERLWNALGMLGTGIAGGNPSDYLSAQDARDRNERADSLEEQQRKQLEQVLGTLPEDERGLARLAPEAYIRSMLENRGRRAGRYLSDDEVQQLNYDPGTIIWLDENEHPHVMQRPPRPRSAGTADVDPDAALAAMGGIPVD